MVAANQEMVPSLYYGIHSARDTWIGGIGFVLSVALLALALAAIGKFRNGVLKLFLGAFFFYNVYSLARPHIVSQPLPWWAKLAVGGVFATLFLLLFLRVGAEGWRKVAKSIIVASAVFVLSPMLIAWSHSSPGQGKLFGIAHAAGVNNYLVLVLDETSPEYTAGMVRELEGAQLHVKSAEVAEAGAATLNAIPSMLSTSRHDDVAPCTPTALCGAQGFDFAALTADGKADVVGFWHPYCAIRGLRSCAREEHVFTDSSSVDFGLYTLWCGQFNRGAILAFCNKTFPRSAATARTRRDMAAQVERAPFWREGGLLYVHFPLPHPSMSGDFPSLRSEYEANVGAAERMVAQLAARLRASFGDDFALVITADHPLRIALWCAAPAYAKPGCAAGLPADRGRVQYIVASPKPVTAVIGATNVGMLAPSRR
jgi:hypothetical protein